MVYSLEKIIIQGGLGDIQQPNATIMEQKLDSKNGINIHRKITGIVKLTNIKTGNKKLEHCKFAIIAKENFVILYNDIFLNQQDRVILSIANQIFSRYQNAKREGMIANESKSN